MRNIPDAIQQEIISGAILMGRLKAIKDEYHFEAVCKDVYQYCKNVKTPAGKIQAGHLQNKIAEIEEEIAQENADAMGFGII